jgi:hypothetical protein
MGNGQPYVEHSCWQDVHAAIEGAHRFIFITGWSVWVNTVLKRVPDSDSECASLGELLKAKANAGVRVRMGYRGCTAPISAPHDKEGFLA